IKKVVYGFQSIDAVLAALGDPAELTLYVTPDTLPEWLADVPETIAKVADDIATESAGKFTYAVVDPTAVDSPISPQELYEHYGLRPYAVSPFSNESYYLQLVLRVGDQAQIVYPQGEASEVDVRIAIESALKRASTGFLKVVGLWTPPAIPTQDMFGEMQQPLSAWQQVGEFLRQEYEVRAMDLSTGRVPADVDVLIVIAPQNMTDLERFAIDQYLMRGGSVVVASGHTMVPDQFTGSLGVQPVQGGLDDVLTSYGVTIEQALVLDLQNEPFPVPEVVDVGGFPVQQITLIDYPFFVDVRPDGMASDSPIISNLPAVTLNWASPVTVDEEKNADREVTPLLQSTTDSWTQSHTNIQPDFALYPELGFPVSGEQQSYTLAVSIQGVFESVFKGQPPPSVAGEEGASQEPLAVIESSPETARLVVIGSAEFLDDKIFELSSSITPDRYLNSLLFLQNAVSWCTEDLDLLSIRSSGTPAHLLLPMTESQQSFWEIANYVVAVLALVAIGVVGNVLRRNEQPMELIDPKTGRKRETVPAEGSTEVEQ
ncbi:MAG: Gldg family protein, partial [Chloroflexi bacterium]|nr:Gldg family protein [Chloroflexota bacterium]